MHESRHILGVKIDFLSKNFIMNSIDAFLGNPEYISSKILSTTNPEFILSAQKDEEFKNIINNSFFSVPDGVGVLYGKEYQDYVKNFFCGKSPHNAHFFSKILYLLEYVYCSIKFICLLFIGRIRIGERISGADLVYDVCELSERKNYTLFLLGGWPTNFWGKPLKDPDFDLAQEAAIKLKELYPNLRIIGATSRFSPYLQDDAITVQYIKDKMLKERITKIDIILVCYGHKKQEKWLYRNLHKIPSKFGIGLGGTFDYVSGIKKRTPRIFKTYHLEWFHRLLTQPWRIKRVISSSIVFPYTIIINNYFKQ